jgi:hypothetical protein
MTTPVLAIDSPRRRDPALAFPLVLIALGVVFLLANAGYLNGMSWQNLAALWPVLFVLLGVDLLLRPRSVTAALIAEVAIIAASLIYVAAAPPLPFGASVVNAGPFVSAQTIAREGASQLSLTLGYGAGNLSVKGSATDLVTVKSTHEDIEVQRNVRAGSSASVDVHSVTPQFVVNGARRAWDVTVPSDIPVAMTLNLGAGDFLLDLSTVLVTSATINNGASNLELALPAPRGNVPITISTGASSVLLRVPAGAQYEVRVTGALNSITGDQTSSGYAAASDRLTITISSGVSSITIR